MKAILVVDMPQTCEECKFESEMLNCGKPMCVATPHRRERIDDDSIRPSWCPLKPIPEKLEDGYGEKNRRAVYWHYEDGWNECIDAILEPKEKQNETVISDRC